MESIDAFEAYSQTQKPCTNAGGLILKEGRVFFDALVRHLAFDSHEATETASSPAEFLPSPAVR